MLVTEDRGLVYPEKQDEALSKLRKIYYDYYSMGRVRNLALRRIFIEGAKHDLWENLKITFQLFESGKYGEKLGIKPLGSGIFHSGALGVLSHSKLKNEDLLYVIYRLCYFQDEQRKQLVKVNYGDLDVEEFGSVYQGLLEFEPVFTELDTSPNFGFVQGTDRSSSGSHYTPEELVRPLIQHSLEYIIQDCIQKPEERLKLNTTNLPKNQLQEKALLAIKVCDISCGSGHILLSAARRIGMELAKVRTGEDQPSPSVMRHAIRDVIRECIYGVDKNPLAVELCKVALWLEAHSPGEPLNFLDHKIKCGDAIVGLAHKEELEKGIAEEAFKALPGDDKAIATQFRNRNREELKKQDQITLEYTDNVNESVIKAIEQFQLFKNLPERTPEEIEAKQKKFSELNTGTNYSRLKSLADMQVAQFFIPKTSENKSYICTDGNYRKYLREKTLPTGMPPAKATALAQEKGFFHYFLEFPEVFAASKNPEGIEGSQEGGFDCILGNPPYLGGQKLTGNFGDNFLEFIKFKYSPIGAVDLVTYFFRRSFDIIKDRGFQSLISTNTIAQGRAREDGLDVIKNKGGSINHAVKSMKWPGVAAVEVSLVTISKMNWNGPFVLNGKSVKTISPYLDDSEVQGNPWKLRVNECKSFQGSIVLGKGFVLETHEAEALIIKDPRNKDVLFPYLNGDDLNNSPAQRPSRWVINFFDWPEEKAKTYSDCYEIIERLVKPERQRWVLNKDGNENIGKYALRKPLPEKWWIYGEKRPALYQAIVSLEEILVINRYSKHIQFGFSKASVVYTDSIVVFSLAKTNFSVLSSELHNHWAWKNSSTMGNSTIRYSPSDCFETFPFPKNVPNSLDQIGSEYYDQRGFLMKNLQLGLTQLYNLFHLEYLTTVDIEVRSKQDQQVCLDAFQEIIRLRELYKEMDEAILEAYCWTDILLRHDFYEVDYLPENDRVRYTIHPDARKEILKRLLELNHQYFEEEAKQGLHKQKDVDAFYEQKGKPMPEEVSKWYVKGKKKVGQKNATAKKPLISLDLFNQPENQNIMKEFGLHEGIYSISDASEISGFSRDKVKRWFKELDSENYEGISGFDPIDQEKTRISFHGLIELVVIGSLREYCSLKDILTARKDYGERTGKAYPFANNNVDKEIKAAGKSVVFELSNGEFITLNGSGQYNFYFITEFFKDIKFNKDGIAERLIPSKGKGSVIIDPKLAGGLPFVKGTKGVTAKMIEAFYNSPNSLPVISKMYGISIEEINNVLNYSS